MAFGGGGPLIIGDPSIVRAKVREKANKIIHPPDADADPQSLLIKPKKEGADSTVYVADVLKALREIQVPPSRETWEMLIATCTKSGDLDTATKCMTQMEAAGMKPSTAVVATVLKLGDEYNEEEDTQRKAREEEETQLEAQRKHSFSVDLW